MTPTDIAALRELVEKATPQNIDTAEEISPGIYECPLCHDGSIEGVTFTNYDNAAIGVQFFGIGSEHKRAEALFRQIVKDLPSLLDEVEAFREALGELIQMDDDAREANGKPDA